MQPIQLTIVVDSAGELKVIGPLHDRLLCYRLLDRAKDAVEAHCNQGRGLVLPASAGLLVPVGFRKNG